MDVNTPGWLSEVVASHILSIPPYVPGKPVEELERELGVERAVKMASNENPLGPSPRALAAVQQHLRASHVYPESSAPRLRTALAERYGLSPDSVILGNGSDEIMQFAAHVFIRPGDEAVMGANAFSMYRIVVEAFGGIPVQVPLKRHASDLKAMAGAVTERTRIVFLAVPNSPTGTIVSRAEFEGFLGSLPRKGLLLVVDEAYREYVRDPDCPIGLDYLNHEVPVLVLRTFSKAYGLAGMRVGYGMAREWIVELLNRVRPPFNVNSLAQTAALAALDDEEHVRRTLTAAREGMEYLVGELKGLGFEVIPSEANFVAFCMNRDARPVYEALLREGVIVRHLGSFGMPECIRVTIGTHSENERFVHALKRVVPCTA
ncbi:MAG: histidinol-phosphate transaminase [Desulfomonilaceae bacterium]|nr:histidinol-phosphate transaminase [Desulfomonilaceae bacterium]